MIDASEFRASLGDGYHHHPSGRMSPGGSFTSNASSYATLTPLQPLPPISTMSDKFSHYGHPHPNAGFSSLMPGMGMGGYPSYDKLGSMGGMNMSPPGGQAPMLANAAIPSPPYSQNGSGAGGLVSSYDSYTHATRELSRLGSPQSPGSSVALHSPTTMIGGLNGLANTPPAAHLAAPATPPQQDVKPFTAVSISTSSATPTTSSSSSADEVEEINTKELAQRISAELKRYSIPQAIFAQRVLCRSQGTLSDLLRNPKPWSKLKSGRETFRRMYKWLEEPEFQRMSALRLAVKMNAQNPKLESSGRGSGGSTATATPVYNPHTSTYLSDVHLGFNSLPLERVGSCAELKSCGSYHPLGAAAAAAQSQRIRRPFFPHVQTERGQSVAIFKETKRPSKEMQIAISQQLGLELSTVGNFFMNARRRSQDKWLDDSEQQLKRDRQTQDQQSQQGDHDGSLGLEDELMHGRHAMSHGMPQHHLRHNINQWSPW
ncbi:one cut domain family member 2 [Galendromus occidentalis]|uniref:One cut domain family member 2 n=1 Tax=Galendromus occidentalis TaxID=34638 RepID=A0AAJ6QMT4_9ACAR|nr:one cut domain family member 2 [Galendromus occidentalis]